MSHYIRATLQRTLDEYKTTSDTAKLLRAMHLIETAVHMQPLEEQPSLKVLVWNAKLEVLQSIPQTPVVKETRITRDMMPAIGMFWNGKQLYHGKHSGLFFVNCNNHRRYLTKRELVIVGYKP